MAVSRRILVRTIADQLEHENTKEVMKRLAAYIIEHKLIHQLDLIVADIEAELAKRNKVVADVTTARPLAEESRNAILDYVRDLTGASTPELRETVDESILGGVIIRTAGNELDSSLKTKLNRLKTI